MSIQPTGSLCFNWVNPDYLFDENQVDEFVNGSLTNSFIYAPDETGHCVENLYEGDVASISVLPKRSNVVFINDVQELPQEVYPILNFYDAFGSSFFVTGFLFDERLYAYDYITGEYTKSIDTRSNNLIINHSIHNPRYSGLDSLYYSDPFFSGIRSKVYSDNNLISEFTSTNQVYYNNTGHRDLTIESDFYDQSGIFQSAKNTFHFKPPQVVDFNIEGEGFFGNQARYALSVEYDTPPANVLYQIYSDTGFHNLIEQFESTEYTLTTGSISQDTSGFFKLTTFDSIGSGDSFYLNQHFVGKNNTIEIEEFNSFKNINYSDNLSGFYCDFIRTNTNSAGSRVRYSIDSTPSSSFDLNSYETGEFNLRTGSLFFNVLDNRTGIHESFYLNLELSQSGTNFIESNKQKIFNFPHVKLRNRHDINYDDGYYTVTFFPTQDFDNHKIIYNISGGSNYYDYNEPISGFNIDYNYEAKLVDVNNSSTVYATTQLSGSLPRPSIALKSSSNVFNLDSYISFNLYADSKHPTRFIRMHRKPGLVFLTGTFPSGIIEYNKFNDYLDHFVENTVVGSYADPSPGDISPRNKNITVTGLDASGDFASGIYQSGLHYLYLPVPYDGFGFGEPLPVLHKSFKNNAIAEKADELQVIAEEEIERLKRALQSDVVLIGGPQTISGVKTFDNDIFIESGNNIFVGNATGYSPIATSNDLQVLETNLLQIVNTRTVYSSRNPLNIGVNQVNVDYSSGQFNVPPILMHGLIAPTVDSPIIATHTVGLPSLTGALVAFSDDIPTTGYYLDLFITSPGSDSYEILPSVTPTSSITPTQTPSITPSITSTPSNTPSITPSITSTPSNTPSITPGA